MLRRALMLSLVALAQAAPAAEPAPAFKIIVNPENSVSELDRKLVADMFLKKATRWPNSELARPVDLGSDAPAREAFSQQVIGRSVSAVKNYWQQLIYSGRGIPPPEAGSDDAVVKYVLKHRAAIGYVSASADVAGAKVLVVRQ